MFICEGEQTRNRGSYTFYSAKNLPKPFASVGGTLRAATRDELKAWLEKMNLEGAVVENDKDETRAVYMHENGGEDHNLAYSSAVHTVKESHERKMTEKRLKQRQEEEREAEEDAERQIGHKMRKKPKTKNQKFVSIKYPSPTTKKLRRGSKDAENEDFFGHREDPFLRTIAGDEATTTATTTTTTATTRITIQTTTTTTTVSKLFNLKQEKQEVTFVIHRMLTTVVARSTRNFLTTLIS